MFQTTISNIKYLVISDIHLGHKKTTTEEIISDLDEFFGHYRKESIFTDIDILFIAGDLFDSLLDFSSTDIHDITLWLGRLMGFCSRHDIKLRILEGTPSHDWKQSKIADTVYDIIEKPFDFKYIDTLHIEYMQDLKLHVLYVPDEWNPSTEETFKQVKKMMRDMSISEVDIAIMHGSFQYQLPAAAMNVPKHRESDYLGIVKKFISIGHIHTHSTYQRIIAQGSFSRLAHGEEEPKGAVLITLAENADSFVFIENKKAKVYKTIKIRFKELDPSIAQVEKVLSTIPENSYVRIKAKKDHPLYVAFEDLKIKYPLYHFSKQSEEEEAEAEQIKASETDQYVPINITKDNIVSMLLSEVKQKYPISTPQAQMLENILVSNNG